MSTNRFLQMAAAGAGGAIPEEINACCCASPCAYNGVAQAGNVLAIPNSSYFVVQYASCALCQYLDYWCMDTNGNVCFKNRVTGNSQSAAYDQEFTPGGVAWDPINNGVVESFWDGNCRLYANFHRPCCSCSCLHFVTGSQIGPTNANASSLAGTNDLFYNSAQNRFVKFFYDTGYIKQVTVQHFGSGNFSCQSSPRVAVVDVKSPGGFGQTEAYFDNCTNTYHFSYVCSGNSSCVKRAYACIYNNDGCMCCACGGFYNTEEGYGASAGGYDCLREIGIFAMSDRVLDANSNYHYGALQAQLYCSSLGSSFNQSYACEICDCAPTLCGGSNSSVELEGFMDTGYSNNLILNHTYCNNLCVHQVVWGSGGYAETICLFSGHPCVRAWKGNAGAHISGAGWSVLAYGHNCQSCYFLRTFKPRVVS